MKGNVNAGYIPRCEALAVTEAQKKKDSLIKYLTVFSLFSGDTYVVEEEVVFGRSVKYHQPAPSGSRRRKKKR